MTHTVNNVPAWAWGRTYMVVNDVNNEWCFYDAWDDANDAFHQAQEMYGTVLKTNNCAPKFPTNV